MNVLDREMRLSHAQMNLKLADLNEQLSTANDKYINSMMVFE